VRSDLFYVFGNGLPIVDNLGVHKTPETLEVYAELGMHVAFFPPNSTHVLQPCDDVIFAMFKKCLNREFFALYRSGCSNRSKERDAGKLLAHLAQKCAETINASVIRTSFRNTGISPFDPELLKRRVFNFLIPLTKFREWSKKSSLLFRGMRKRNVLGL
jgi:hypothetical protein